MGEPSHPDRAGTPREPAVPGAAGRRDPTVRRAAEAVHRNSDLDLRLPEDDLQIADGCGIRQRGQGFCDKSQPAVESVNGSSDRSRGGGSVRQLGDVFGEGVEEIRARVEQGDHVVSRHGTQRLGQSTGPRRLTRRGHSPYPREDRYGRGGAMSDLRRR
jgi:hypothetical protein